MIINTEKTKKKREIYMPVESFEFLKEDNWKKTRNGLQCGLDTFKAYANISYKLTWHTLRRTFATTAYGLGIDIDSIAMCLGNSPRVCQEYYIISSERNYDAFEIVNSYHNNKLEKTGNMYLKKFHKLKKK
jgi:site-specific recombinase XerD